MYALHFVAVDLPLYLYLSSVTWHLIQGIPSSTSEQGPTLNADQTRLIVNVLKYWLVTVAVTCLTDSLYFIGWVSPTPLVILKMGVLYAIMANMALVYDQLVSHVYVAAHTIADKIYEDCMVKRILFDNDHLVSSNMDYYFYLTNRSNMAGAGS
jgi:hypothetical protein